MKLKFAHIDIEGDGLRKKAYLVITKSKAFVDIFNHLTRYGVDEWMFHFDYHHQIECKDIISMKELSDEEIIKTHNQCVIEEEI